MAWHWQFICKTLWSTQPAFLSVSNRTPIKRCRWRLCARSRQQIQQKQADRNKSYYGSLQPPPSSLSTLTRFHKEMSASHFELSHILLCLLGRKSLPRPLQRANQKRDRQKKQKQKQKVMSFPLMWQGFFFWFITWNEKHPLLQSHSPLWRLDNKEYLKERE